MLAEDSLEIGAHYGGKVDIGRWSEWRTRRARALRQDASEKVADVLRDFTMVRLEREMSCVEQVDLGTREIPLVGKRAGRNERRVVPPPHGEERRLTLPERCRSPAAAGLSIWLQG